MVWGRSSSRSKKRGHSGIGELATKGEEKSQRSFFFLSFVLRSFWMVLR